ncbi:hypothetical protein THAOC_17967, partial [Thalassiosira oceanica]
MWFPPSAPAERLDSSGRSELSTRRPEKMTPHQTFSTPFASRCRQSSRRADCRFLAITILEHAQRRERESQVPSHPPKGPTELCLARYPGTTERPRLFDSTPTAAVSQSRTAKEAAR